MNIYICNCSNTFNYGSMMMCENFMCYFDKVSGGINRYYVETEHGINTERLKHATGIDEIYPVAMNSLFVNGLCKTDCLMAVAGLKKVSSDFARKIDMAVVLGGDDFTEDYGFVSPVVFAFLFNLFIKEGGRLVMLGQTMGPFHSYRVPIMKVLLKKIDRIFTREDRTYRYLETLKLKNICLSDDLALLPLSKQKQKEKTDRYILFFPSELIYRYAKEGNRKDWIDFCMFMIRHLLNRFPDKELVLLPHVLMPKHVDDRIIIRELQETDSRLIAMTKEMLPYEIRDYIQNSLFIVSARMHPVISAIQCGIPAVALAYSDKYQGIIGEKFKLEECIIDVRYNTYNEMKEDFVRCIEDTEKRREEQIEKMKIFGEIAKENIMESLKWIKEELNDRSDRK
jgi:colanic acid/amylovoran biosynthesis protein